MASPNAALLPPPPAGGDARRPCPYCGTWNQAEFSFCQKCGRSLPAAATAASPAVVTGLGPLPPPPSVRFAPPPSGAPLPPFAATASEDTPVLDRPMTDAEKGSLKLAAKNGAAGMTRFFGAFLGIVPLAMIGMAFMGTPFVPENYIVIVMGGGFLAVALAAASQSLRRPLAHATRDGNAHEVYGVPEIQASSGPWSLVTLAGLTFRMKTSVASGLLPNRMNRLTFADGGPIAGGKGSLGNGIAFLLEANGKPIPRAERCFVMNAAGAEVAAAETLARKKAGGR